MRQCIIVPGYLESNLNTDPLQTYRLWVSYPRLILGHFGGLRLAPNSTAPGPPDGLECYPAGTLPEYFLVPTTQLQFQMGQHGYNVIDFGWDWRKPMFSSGNLLADEVRRLATAEDPCTLVAHSAGGLVCRAAWASLVASGDEAKVRRVITLGSPHLGTYFACAAWLPDNPMIVQLVQLNQSIGYVDRVYGGGTTFTAWTAEEMCELTRTWPSTYELLPLLDAGDAADDPLRAALYVDTNWPAAHRPQQFWLDWSRLSFGPWLRSEVSQIPGHVLTTVSGTNTSTSCRLADPHARSSSAAFGSTTAGDGVVTCASAEVPGSAIYRTTARHEDLLGSTVNTGELADWILDERSPSSPTPSPVMRPALRVPVLDGPPLPRNIDLAAVAAECKGGICQC